MHTAADRPFTIIRAQSIARVLRENRRAVVDVVRDAYLAHDAGRTVNPASVFLRMPEHPNARIIGLPAHLRAPVNLSGIKWIASYPDNIQRGVARASAVLLLNDGDDGYPFACLEASLISAARTAASAALAAEQIQGERGSKGTVGLIGTGLITRTFCEFLFGLGWEAPRVRVFDLNPAASEAFKLWFAKIAPGVEVEICADGDTVLRESALTFLATVSAAPHLHSVESLAHAPTVLHISLRDLDPEMILQAQNIVDDADHVCSAGTSVFLAAEKTGNRSFITGSIAQLVAGRCRLDYSRPTIFSPFGLGILDLALGKWVYDRVLESQDAISVNEFFPAA